MVSMNVLGERGGVVEGGGGGKSGGISKEVKRGFGVQFGPC
jgi:hypothetical protein